MDPFFYSNFFLRAVFSILMLSLFLKLASKNKIWLVFISLVLTLGITIELIGLTRDNSGAFSQPIVIIVLLSAPLFLFNTIPALALLYPRVKILVKLCALKSVIFAFYSLGLVLSIINLNRESLKKQLLLVTVIHAGSFICGLACALSIRNIIAGKFFYVYPALLVIMNDIFAYLVGKSMGKTPLICLSPNKTVEGFIGGFLFTFLAGTVISWLKINGRFLPDEHDEKLSSPINKNIVFLNIPYIYLHNLFFVLAASFFAPFCGFLASAIKRAFGKKDFSGLIPGHGGMADRFDCQILMVFFTHYYLRGITEIEESSVQSVYNIIIENLRPEEITVLYNKINDTIKI